jgi:ketosteroid isomerase-like protein
MQPDSETPLWLTNFIDTYQNLSVDNLSDLKSVYHQDVVFQDPLHLLCGFDNLADYFDQLYQNVSACRFDIKQVIHQDNHAAVYWLMTYRHKQLKGGKSIEVEGHSLLIGQDDKVIAHRDYLDLGQMFYEHVPLLGGIVRWLKRRAAA